VLSRPDHVVLETLDPGFQWTTVDPFIVTVHHLAWFRYVLTVQARLGRLLRANF